MVAFQVGSTDARVYYRSNGDSHLNELPHYQGSWHFRDLTADTGAPVATCCDLAAFTAGAADSRVYYKDNAGNIWELAHYQVAGTPRMSPRPPVPRWRPGRWA